MKKFLIAEAEKSRILGMHYKAMGKSLVNEQGLPDNLWSKYVEATNNLKPGSRTIETGPEQLSDEQIKKYKLYDVGFIVSDNRGGTQQAQYQCIDSEPDERIFKGGKIYDSSGNLTKIDAELDAAGIPWRPMFDWACKPAMSVLAARKAKQQPQVAAATTTTVTAPNPTTDKDAADAQKRAEESRAKRTKAAEDFKNLMASNNFLDPNKDNAVLDKEVNQLKEILKIMTPMSSDLRILLPQMSYLVRTKPEYGADPYGLTQLISTLKNEL